MATTASLAHIHGMEEIEETQVRREGRFLFFKTEWWETVSTKHIGNDLHIRTAGPIRNIYINGARHCPSPEESK